MGRTLIFYVAKKTTTEEEAQEEEEHFARLNVQIAAALSPTSAECTSPHLKTETTDQAGGTSNQPKVGSNSIRRVVRLRFRWFDHV